MEGRHLDPHSDIRNVHEDYHESRSFGQRAADAISASVGAWKFILIQSTILVLWIASNSIQGLPHWDVEPYILLNLMLSFQAAYTGPIVMMSQNRQSVIDRMKAAEDHKIIVHIAEELDEVRGRFGEVMSEITGLHTKLGEVNAPAAKEES